MWSTHMVNLFALALGLCAVVGGISSYQLAGNASNALIAAWVFVALVLAAWVMSLYCNYKMGMWEWLMDKAFILILVITLIVYLSIVFQNQNNTTAGLVLAILGAILCFVGFASSMTRPILSQHKVH